MISEHVGRSLLNQHNYPILFKREKRVQSKNSVQKMDMSLQRDSICKCEV